MVIIIIMSFSSYIYFAKNDLIFLSQRCDLNKDGRLDYNEFKALIYRNKERKDLNAERAKAMVRRKSSKMQELREVKKSV